MSETALQKHIQDGLEKLGYWVIRTARSKKRGFKSINTGEDGMPDLCLPALGWGEVKLPGKELEPDQIAWHARAHRHGIRTGVWHSLEEALRDAMAWSGQRAGSAGKLAG